MRLTVTGKQIDVGDALRSYVAASLETILSKYFGSAIEAHVAFAREAHLVRADVAIHVGRGIVVNSTAVASDFYPAFDAAAGRLGKQLRRYKRRLRDHHAKERAPGAQGGAVEEARSYILQPVDEEADGAPDGSETEAPVIIAEMSAELPSLTVGEAVMRLDLADAPALLFRNRSHGGLNLVYRRSDGNIGWIDPAPDAGRRAMRH